MKNNEPGKHDNENRPDKESGEHRTVTKEFKDIVLCRYFSKNLFIRVTASLQDGKLTITGQDIGDIVELLLQDDDYEYWYWLDKEGTYRLLEVIHGQKDPKSAILKEFSGTDGCMKFAKVCDENHIPYGHYTFA